MKDLYALIQEDAFAMESSFRKSSLEGKGSPQEIADFREHSVQEFVKRFFPFPHRITKGKIRDSFGAISDSIDCVVCNPNHPYTIDAQKKFTLLFAEGIDAAIEVKPDISSKDELIRGLEQGLTVKNLRRANPPTLLKIPWMVEQSSRVPFVIFAMKCKSDPMDTGKEIVEFYKSKGTPPAQQADFVFVNNVGIFANYLDAAEYRFKTIDQPFDKKGWFFEDWREKALAGFLWHLLLVSHASIKMSEDILPRYLVPKVDEGTGIYGVYRIPT